MHRLTTVLLAAILPATAMAQTAPETTPEPPPRVTPGTAPAPPSPRSPNVMTVPWDRKPTFDVIREAYPAAARATSPDGRVDLSCEVADTGLLTGCAVVSETPPGLGFGAAALSLTGRYRVRVKLADGTPTAGGKVRIPLRFDGSPMTVSGLPAWLPAPTPGQLRAIMPARDTLILGWGRVDVTCRVGANDRLKSCTARGDPADPRVGERFRPTALSLVRDMTVLRRPGLEAPAAEETVTFKLTFEMD